MGLTLTLGLALAGFDVALIDRAPLKALANEAHDGRATALRWPLCAYCGAWVSAMFWIVRQALSGVFR